MEDIEMAASEVNDTEQDAVGIHVKLLGMFAILKCRGNNVLHLPETDRLFLPSARDCSSRTRLNHFGLQKTRVLDYIMLMSPNEKCRSDSDLRNISVLRTLMKILYVVEREACSPASQICDN